jgi:hypothetical protein
MKGGGGMGIVAIALGIAVLAVLVFVAVKFGGSDAGSTSTPGNKYGSSSGSSGCKSCPHAQS